MITLGVATCGVGAGAMISMGARRDSESALTSAFSHTLEALVLGHEQQMPGELTNN